MKTLTLNLKTEYFNDIRDGYKKEEYRLYTKYWQKRLLNKAFNNIVVCKGYPKKNDYARRITFPWRGFEVKEITHKHFGNDPVKVFAIKLT